MVLDSRTALTVLLWSVTAASSLAQPATPAKRPDPADAQAAVPPLVYRSTVPQSAPPAEAQVGSWPKANETVWRIGGWRTYAREAAQSDAPSQAAPPASAASHPETRP